MIQRALSIDFLIGHETIRHEFLKRIYLAVQLAQLVLVRHTRPLQIVCLLLQLCLILVREALIRLNALLDLHRLCLLCFFVGDFLFIGGKCQLCGGQILLYISTFIQ